jgi:hypothetical protein
VIRIEAPTQIQLGEMFKIPKSMFAHDEVRMLKVELTVESEIDGSKLGFGGNNEPVKMYEEALNTFSVPRRFGFTRYRDLPVIDKRSNGNPVNLQFRGQLRPQQEEPVQKLLHALKTTPWNGAILESPCGCHAKGTKILMADGTAKAVEDIIVGDRVMGRDGPRNVLALHRGRAPMARVIPTKGEPFMVNEDHILTAVWSGDDNPRKDGDIWDISVKDWFAASENVRRHLVLFRPEVDRFEVEQLPLPIPAYHLGMLLGDGSLRTTSITTEDPEIVAACEELALKFGLEVRRGDSNGTRCASYYLNSGCKHAGSNKLKNALRGLGLLTVKSGDKFVPTRYLTASLADRLALIAGLLDTDGSYASGGFDWISKSPRLAADVVFLCRSVGLAAYVRPCKKRDQHGNGGTYHRVSISGHCDIIPTRVARKRAAPRRINKDCRRVGFRIERLPEDDYFGFEVDGDHRYLMGDFTWTHNSGKTCMALKVAADLGLTTLVVVHKEFLVDQWKERIQQFLGLPASKIGHIQQDMCTFKGKPIAIGMIHSLAEKEYVEDLYPYFGTVIYDEVHRVGAPMFSKSIPKFPAKYRIGVSATPDRKDGLEKVFLWHIGDVIRGTGGWELKPTVYLIDYTGGVSQDWATGFGGRTNLGKLVTLITQDVRRNVWLAGEIKKAGLAGRKILVLSDRIEHLEVLRRMLKSHAPSLSSAMYIGGLSGSERERAADADIMFGTAQYAKEGLDIPGLDTLYLTTPHTDVEQMVGRILRTCSTKKAPIVVDVVDNMPLTRAFGNKRVSFYMDQGFEVRRLKV